MKNFVFCLLLWFGNGSDEVPNRYIVTLKPGTNERAQAQFIQQISPLSLFSKESDKPKTVTIGDKFVAVIATFDAIAIKALESHPYVESVEPDRIVSINAGGFQFNTPNWNLPRISTRKERFLFKSLYTYPYSAGDGVDVYVIDTGVDVTHPEFDDRAVIGASFVNGTENDGHGHGTHVAGTIAGKWVGVAKEANIIGVKVLDAKGKGSWSGILKGIQWSVENSIKTKRQSVANLSFGGPKSEAINKAVKAAVENGLTIVVAGGNDSQDACNASPASAVEAITVGASAKDDSIGTFSNYGTCLTLYAPGVDIYSLWNDKNYKIISGTSMAAAHVAGVAALYLSEGVVKDPLSVKVKILERSTKVDLKGISVDSPRMLLYNHPWM